MRKTKKIAVCAVFSALVVLLLFLACVIDVLDLTVVAIASLLVTAAHIEIGKPYDYLIWAVGSVLGLVLLPNKMPAVLFVLFGGIYPILKAIYEQMPRIPAWILKFLTFNAGFALAMLAARYILLLPAEDYRLSVVLFAVANAAFFFYDVALTGLIRLYVLKFRHSLGLDRFFRA